MRLRPWARIWSRILTGRLPASQAFDAAFPGGERAWTPVRFAENPAEEWTREAVIRWVDQEPWGFVWGPLGRDPSTKRRDEIYSCKQ